MKDPGIYTSRQLTTMLGYTDAEIRSAVASGTLIRLRRGWFAAPIHDARAASAVRDGGILTCADALRFHGLWVPPGHDGLHLRRSTNLSGKHRGCRPLRGALRSATQAVDPIPQALSCAARCLDPDEWIAVSDSYLNITGKNRGDLRVELDGAGPTVARLIDKTDGRSQSGTESIARVRLRSEGFEVVVQPTVDRVGRCDLRIGLLIIECDSKLYHATRAGYFNDRRRDRRALGDEWLPFRLTYDDVLYGWTESLEDIREITDRERHRARSARKIALVEKSVRQSAR
ncbi:MAG: hypothetical protein WBA05_05680 [Gordonia sp. (in: high G+C Gram-positive bacteria)]|uniref:hypothetical protein n=1 Tax=Gordonia sp. (in: high G+C Gram-positive bacteria) TaxID=84139 RepID=UPI003C768599